MKLENLILPVGACVVLFALLGCLAGPAIGLTPSEGTGWGCLGGLVAGVLFGVVANSGKQP